MPSKLDQLKNKTEVDFRCSVQLAATKVAIQYDEKVKGIRVFQMRREGHQESFEIDDEDIDQGQNVVTSSSFLDFDTGFAIYTKDIQELTARDYDRGNDRKPAFVLCVIQKEEKETSLVEPASMNPPAQQESRVLTFRFANVQDRDSWESGLRSLISSPMKLQRNSSTQPKNKPQLDITSLSLEKPGGGRLVKVKVQMCQEKEAFLEVLDNQCSAEDVRSVTSHFVHQHNLIMHDAKSLYRYVMSLVSRARIHKDTLAIVKEINLLDLETMVNDEANGEQVAEAIQAGVPRHRALFDKAQDSLDNLIENFDTRMLQQGPGAAIVVKLIRRNIQKMKIVNEQRIMAYDIAPSALPPPALPFPSTK